MEKGWENYYLKGSIPLKKDSSHSFVRKLHILSLKSTSLSGWRLETWSLYLSPFPSPLQLYLDNPRKKAHFEYIWNIGHWPTYLQNPFHPANPTVASMDHLDPFSHLSSSSFQSSKKSPFVAVSKKPLALEEAGFCCCCCCCCCCCWWWWWWWWWWWCWWWWWWWWWGWLSWSLWSLWCFVV